MRTPLVMVALLLAAPQVRAQLPSRAGATSSLTAVRTPAIARPSFVRADSSSRPRRHVGRAALIGAGVGFVAGAIGGSFVGTGCDVTSRATCSPRRQQLGVMLFFGAEGAAAGAGIGALIGLAMPPRGARQVARVP